LFTLFTLALIGKPTNRQLRSHHCHAHGGRPASPLRENLVIGRDKRNDPPGTSTYCGTANRGNKSLGALVCDIESVLMHRHNESPWEAVAPKGAEQAEPGVRNLDVIPKPELVFGLVGAVGTDLKLLTTLLTQQLARVGYKTSAIRLSELLKQLP